MTERGMGDMLSEAEMIAQMASEYAQGVKGKMDRQEPNGPMSVNQRLIAEAKAHPSVQIADNVQIIQGQPQKSSMKSAMKNNDDSAYRANQAAFNSAATYTNQSVIIAEEDDEGAQLVAGEHQHSRQTMQGRPTAAAGGLPQYPIVDEQDKDARSTTIRSVDLSSSSAATAQSQPLSEGRHNAAAAMPMSHKPTRVLGGDVDEVVDEDSDYNPLSTLHSSYTSRMKEYEEIGLREREAAKKRAFIEQNEDTAAYIEDVSEQDPEEIKLTIGGEEFEKHIDMDEAERVLKLELALDAAKNQRLMKAVEKKKQKDAKKKEKRVRVNGKSPEKAVVESKEVYSNIDIGETPVEADDEAIERAPATITEFKQVDMVVFTKEFDGAHRLDRSLTPSDHASSRGASVNDEEKKSAMSVHLSSKSTNQSRGGNAFTGNRYNHVGNNINMNSVKSKLRKVTQTNTKLADLIDTYNVKDSARDQAEEVIAEVERSFQESEDGEEDAIDAEVDDDVNVRVGGDNK